MEESAKHDQQDVSPLEAIALTLQALRNTRKILRDSDELLSLSRAMRRADESPDG